MKRFFAIPSGNTASLSEQESHHALHVLRCSAGEEVEVVDGNGGLWMGIFEKTGKRGAMVGQLRLLQQVEDNPEQLILAVSPTKNADRIEWLVEKATELGLRKFIPLLCSRTERPRINTERLENIALAAMKQSGKLFLPEIAPLTPLEKLWQEPATQHFLAHCYDGGEKKMLNLACTPGATVIIAIGPEGDFTPGEVSEAKNSNWSEISLGSSRLRVETAALYATAVVKMVNEWKE